MNQFPYKEVVEIVEQLTKDGINSVPLSVEYETYLLLCEILLWYEELIDVTSGYLPST
jgi:hypothetical protein